MENEIPTVEKPINKWIISQINQKIGDATEALEGFQTRKALQAGLFLFRKDVDYYLNRITSIEQEEKDTLTYINENKVYLIKPYTYINNSGLVIKYLLSFLNINTKNILVLVDDINLKFCEIRLRY